MAIRIKSRWHRSKRSRKNIEGSAKPKSVEDLSSVIAFNIWKIAQETFRHMEKEGFRFSRNDQVIGLLTEMIAFLIQVVDRIVYEKMEENKRQIFINGVASHLVDTLESNLIDLFGPGEYREPFVDKLNHRLDEYAECTYDEEGPGYAFKRLLGEKISAVMEVTDNKWAIEHVMEIEIPIAVKNVKQLTVSALALK